MTILEKINNLVPIDNTLVSHLYNLSNKTIIIVFFLNLLISYFLYPVVGNLIFFWSSLFMLLLGYRTILLYQYSHNSKKYSTQQWYIKFLISALLTAVFFSALNFLMFPYSENILAQILVIMLLIGYASGSHSALISDIRIGISYILIITFPLILRLLSYDNELYHILSIFISLHLIALILIQLQNYHQQNKLRTVTKILDNKQNLLHTVIEESPLPIFSCDSNLIIVDVNHALIKLMKKTKDEIIGININTFSNQKFIDAILKALEKGSSQYSGEYHTSFGIELWVEIIFLAQYNVEHARIGVIALIEDKTKEHQAHKQLEYSAIHDELTNLLNRRGFIQTMTKYINQRVKSHHYSILFYLDLNQFKVINDSLGHHIGDEVLKKVAQRLLGLTLKDCIISRLGGDEFVVLMPDIQPYQKVEDVAHNCAHIIENLFIEPLIIDTMYIHIQPSIGVVIIEPENNHIEDILRYADLAMYRAKKSKTNISYYDKSLDEEQKELITLQHDLSYAIENNELEIYLQPIIKLNNNTLYAAELLIRWKHPLKGLLSPDQFIPLAIKAGLLSKITWWIIDKVCQQIMHWQQSKQWKLNYISINIDTKQLIEQGFIYHLLKKLKKYHIAPRHIILEITERSLIDNFQQTQKIISELEKKGVLCAIDDFGVGYSSLSYLQKLSCHILKVDKSFIESIHNKKELALLSTIINIGKEFEYQIVIEGIEQESQKSVLLELDNTLFYQGYLYSKPVDTQTFTKAFLN